MVCRMRQPTCCFSEDIDHKKNIDFNSKDDNNDIDPCIEAELFTKNVKNKFNYDRNSFVVFRPEKGDKYLPLWISKIMDTISTKGAVVSLNAHRYQLYSNSFWLTAIKAPTYQEGQWSRFKKPWKVKISPESVVDTFSSLKMTWELSTSAQTFIRNDLSMLKARSTCWEESATDCLIALRGRMSFVKWW